MSSWNNFLVQQMGVDAYEQPYPVKESVAAWGIWCKDIPFKLFDKVKEPASRNWFDEHGHDEYISPDGLYLDAYNISIELGCKKLTSAEASKYGAGAAVTDVRSNVNNFLTWLRQAGFIKIYSTYTRIGRQNVRLVSVDDNATWGKDVDGDEFLIFKIELKVGDPVTDVTLTTSS